MNEQVGDWQALSVRVSTFHRNIRQDLKQDAILPAFGVEVDSVEVKPNELRRTEIAPLGPGRLHFSSNLNRTDWVWQSLEDKEPHVALGAPGDVVERFVHSVKQWAIQQDDIVRVAVGGIFGIEVETRENAYTVLDALIPELTLDPSSADFFYQINRPGITQAEALDVVVNQIEKWSCRRVSRADFAFSFHPSGLFPSTANNEIVDVAIHAACELDFNTDASNTVSFAASACADLLDDLCSRMIAFLRERHR